VVDSSPRVALVTGGAARIGRAIVEALAGRGYAVAIHANTSIDEASGLAERLSQDGAESFVVQADLRDELATRAMIDQVDARFGRLDVLINNAAIFSPSPLEEVTADKVRECLDINTLSPFVCSQHAGLKMASQESGGVIVNIGDWAIERPYVDYSAYLLSKGAIPTLTRTFAVELSHRNPKVRVNAVLPGPVAPPPTISGDEWQEAITSTLLKRGGTPQNIAQAALFFIENDFVTGVCLAVDGGRTLA